MKKMLLPLVLLLIGVGGGIGAGLVLTPAPEEEIMTETPIGDGMEEPHVEEEAHVDPVPLEDRAYVRMNNQFVVPVVSDGLVSSLIVISLSIEVETGGQEAVFAQEPKLRDAFLQTMFDHANIGGFDGAFTASSNMRLLREALQDAADEIMLGHISDVLITDIVRQDVKN